VNTNLVLVDEMSRLLYTKIKCTFIRYVETSHGTWAYNKRRANITDAVNFSDIDGGISLDTAASNRFIVRAPDGAECDRCVRTISIMMTVRGKPELYERPASMPLCPTKVPSHVVNQDLSGVEPVTTLR
jgi:hypothetical protein